jgi:hypothetical protein
MQQFRAGDRPEWLAAMTVTLPQPAYAVDGWGIRPNCISSET